MMMMVAIIGCLMVRRVLGVGWLVQTMLFQVIPFNSPPLSLRQVNEDADVDDEVFDINRIFHSFVAKSVAVYLGNQREPTTVMKCLLHLSQLTQISKTDQICLEMPPPLIPWMQVTE